MFITLTVAVMSRRGVLGYQEGTTLCDGRTLRPRAVPDGLFRFTRGDPFIALPKLPLTTSPACVTPSLVASPVAVTRLGVDPNKPRSISSSNLPIIPDRRRANTAAKSTCFDLLSLDSGILRSHLLKRENYRNKGKRSGIRIFSLGS